MKSFLNLFRKKSSSDISSSSEKETPVSSPSVSFISSSPSFTYKKHKTHVVKKPRPYRLNRYAKAVLTSNGNPAALAKALQMQGDPPKDLPDYKELFPSTPVTVTLTPSTEYVSSFVPVNSEKWTIQKYSITYGKIPERRKPSRWLKEGLHTTYKRCNIKYVFKPGFTIPRRILTTPTIPRHNGGADNENYDLIMHVGDILGSAVSGSQNKRCWHKGSRYTVLDLLGRGTFGQVVKCRDEEHGRLVAVKVLKNKSAYFRQGLLEIAVLTAVNSECDPTGERHTLRLLDHFLHQNHLCIVTELLSMSLYDVIKSGGFRGVTVRLARAFLRQLLDALCSIEAHRVVHCDLKPENVLLTKPGASAITLIDFGSACFEESTLYTYIQSRHYRAPEVILGLQYTCAIDMWSLGCIAAELFLGIPIFPGTSEYNQLFKITSMLGMPPPEMVEQGVHAGKFFRTDAAHPGRYVLKSVAEYERDANVSLEPDRRYMNYVSLEDFAENVPMKTGYASTPSASAAQDPAEIRRSFLSFLRGVLELDPTKRLTPDQALRHPFLAEVPLEANYAPPEPQRPRPTAVVPARPGPLKIPAGTQSKAAGLSAAEVYGVFLKRLREEASLVDVASGIELCRVRNEVRPRRVVSPPPPVPQPEYEVILMKRTKGVRGVDGKMAYSPYNGIGLDKISGDLSDDAGVLASKSYASAVEDGTFSDVKRRGARINNGGDAGIGAGNELCDGLSPGDSKNGGGNSAKDMEPMGLKARHSKKKSVGRELEPSPTTAPADATKDGEKEKLPKSQLKKSRKITILELENENGMLSLASPMMSASMARTARKEAEEAKLAAQEAAAARSKEMLTTSHLMTSEAIAIKSTGGSGTVAKKKKSGSSVIIPLTTTSLTSLSTSRGMLDSIPDFSLNGASKEGSNTNSGNNSLSCSCDDGEMMSPKTLKLKKKKSGGKKKRKELCIDDDEDDVDEEEDEEENDDENVNENNGGEKIAVKKKSSNKIKFKNIINDELDNNNSNSNKLILSECAENENVSDDDDDDNDDDEGSGTASYSEDVVKQEERRKKKKKKHKTPLTSENTILASPPMVMTSSLLLNNNVTYDENDDDDSLLSPPQSMSSSTTSLHKLEGTTALTGSGGAIATTTLKKRKSSKRGSKTDLLRIENNINDDERGGEEGGGEKSEIKKKRRSSESHQHHHSRHGSGSRPSTLPHSVSDHQLLSKRSSSGKREKSKSSLNVPIINK